MSRNRQLFATAYARATVEAGFTTVRDLGSRFVGSREFVDVALRNSINKGVIVGPRMLVATKGIGATGGHFDPRAGFAIFLFGREPDYTDGIADGPDEIRKAVRFEVKNGADVIKAAVSGGVLSLADEVDTPQLTPAEMAALVDESHRLRKKVAVHCHGDQAAREAIEAGVDSIEHGSFMKPETLTMMKKKGIFLTPTLMATEWIMGKIDNYPPALQGEGKSGCSRTVRYVSECGENGRQNFIWNGRRGVSARRKRKGVQADGGSGHEPDRCIEISYRKRRRASGDCSKSGHAGKRETGRRDCGAGRSDC